MRDLIDLNRWMEMGCKTCRWSELEGSEEPCVECLKPSDLGRLWEAGLCLLVMDERRGLR